MNRIFAKMFFFKRHRIVKPRTKLSREDYLKFKNEARQFVEERVGHFSKMYSFEFNRISIRNQRTRWGSCSEKGNLNFNYRILFLPPHISDYLIAHEICHLKELNHSRKFWNLVGEIIPDYSNIKKELKQRSFYFYNVIKS